MAILDLLEILRLRQSRPFSILVTAAALFAPVSLTIFIERPGLFADIGLTGVLLVSVSASLPILMLCFSIWYTPLKAIADVQRKYITPDSADLIEADLASEINKDDPLEWPCLLSGGWTANVVLYGLVGWAYFNPISVGRSLLFIAAILLGIWLIVFAASTALALWADHTYKRQNGASPPDPTD